MTRRDHTLRTPLRAPPGTSAVRFAIRWHVHAPRNLLLGARAELKPLRTPCVNWGRSIFLVSGKLDLPPYQRMTRLGHLPLTRRQTFAGKPTHTRRIRALKSALDSDQMGCQT